jgi:hypothetical protein
LTHYKISVKFTQEAPRRDSDCVIVPFPAHHNLPLVCYPKSQVLPNTLYDMGSGYTVDESLVFEVSVHSSEEHKTKAVIVKMPVYPYHYTYYFMSI